MPVSRQQFDCGQDPLGTDQAEDLPREGGKGRKVDEAKHAQK
jgi:hypothetical protein